jgi:anti-anti-sigma factor
MRVIEIDQDMDHAGMSKLRDSFDSLGRGGEDVCLDLSGVRFMDSAGIEGMVSLHRTLRLRSRRLKAVHVRGQPRRILREALREPDRDAWLRA